MGWVLTKAFRFEAAHHLPAHDGKCARVHGHSWVGEIEVRGDSLITEGPKRGMVIDYGDLAAAVQGIVENWLDHHDLNRTTGLRDPTSEALAQWVYDRLRPVLRGLVAVTIHETCTARCRYASD